MSTAASAEAERVEVSRIFRAVCFEHGCDFHVRGDEAEAEAAAHSKATQHKLIRQQFSGENWFARPRSPQRKLAERALAAATVEEVRAIFREAAQMNLLDEAIHNATGSRPLQVMLKARAQELEAHAAPAA